MVRSVKPNRPTVTSPFLFSADQKFRAVHLKFWKRRTLPPENLMKVSEPCCSCIHSSSPTWHKCTFWGYTTTQHCYNREAAFFLFAQMRTPHSFKNTLWEIRGELTITQSGPVRDCQIPCLLCWFPERLCAIWGSCSLAFKNWCVCVSLGWAGHWLMGCWVPERDRTQRQGVLNGLDAPRHKTVIYSRSTPGGISIPKTLITKNEAPGALCQQPTAILPQSRKRELSQYKVNNLIAERA